LPLPSASGIHPKRSPQHLSGGENPKSESATNIIFDINPLRATAPPH